MIRENVLPIKLRANRSLLGGNRTHTFRLRVDVLRCGS
ncbi:hypothetical protein RB11429 [Rhodopirellula baltica SH 1]|uniref:Uncharacterized protein n=1 Tax=Rhodopirellula baltica (strain DSM 10527 / NCIMB 13988 / SH1) TaxID=243090 RepID=Q7UEC2_RHOBA|nr:hypothetical protein RB11429 [Rhodopirellula baltica SH 1]